MPAEIRLFVCLKDNYGVLLHDPATGATAAIDAPEAASIEAALGQAGWRPNDILVTHHHGDHTAGIAELKQRYGCRVVAPAKEASRIPLVDVPVREDDSVKVGSLVAEVLETPGHTGGHIAYWFRSEGIAFVGDTLFSVGCGRVIEGTAEMMWRSLVKLRELPESTNVYCGHEYTAANVRFALTVDPDNAALRARAEEVTRLSAAGQPTIPTTIGSEKATNPFLRADVPALAAAVGLADAPAAQVFAHIRAQKDRF
jgi:hydroxyacylglutathione hydrolase